MSFLNDLNENGYCVIPNILDSNTCDNYIERIWDWLESLNSGINRDEPNSWKGTNWPPNTRGIFKHFKVGQEQFVWDLRCEPSIIEVFQKIWKTNNLLVSFDTINVMRPPELYGGRPSKKRWFHMDQSSTKKGLHCVQGLVTLENMTDQDGTLVVLKKSHKYFADFFNTKHTQVEKNNWYKLKDSEVNWYLNKDVEEIKVNAPKGSLVLWDSRVVHCNAPPEKNRPIQRFRYVIYVCMTPKSMATSKQLEKKKKAFLEKRMTSHWPHEIYLCSEKFQTWGKEYPDYNVNLDLPELTNQGRKLAGLI